MNDHKLWEALEASWPPVSKEICGAFIWRDGGGGGKRVSAATAAGPVNEQDLSDVEARFAREQRAPLFRVRADETLLDEMLARRGYDIVDPTVCLIAPCDTLANPCADHGYASWPPIAIQRKIWSDGGIDAARLAIMQRAATQKTSLLARNGETPVGTAFVAAVGRYAVLHALEISQTGRRHGSGTHLMQLAAYWAQNHQVEHLALLVTQANKGAQAFYSSLGMRAVAHYHYRRKGQ